MGKTEDESMSAIQFCTNPKGYLPHYFYIFINMDPLRKDINNVSCYRLGTMLHLDTQNGKEDMKSNNFQKYTTGTAVYMRIPMMDTKVCDQLTPKYP